MKKYVIIMIIGAVIAGLATTASADELQPVFRDEKTGIDDQDLLPPTYKEDLLIVPNPDSTIDHNPNDDEKNIEKKDVLIQIQESEENEETVDSALTISGADTNSDTSKYGFETQVILVVGAFVILLFSFIILRKK